MAAAATDRPDGPRWQRARVRPPARVRLCAPLRRRLCEARAPGETGPSDLPLHVGEPRRPGCPFSGQDQKSLICRFACTAKHQHVCFGNFHFIPFVVKPRILSVLEVLVCASCHTLQDSPGFSFPFTLNLSVKGFCFSFLFFKIFCLFGGMEQE